MSSAALIPQAFWFRMALTCPHIDGIPREGTKGRLLDLPESAALPQFTQLEGRPSWAEIRTAWNARGLGIAVEVTGKTGPIGADPGDPAFSDGIQLCLDTRDTRDVHRATRFCHRFSVSLAPTRDGSKLKVDVLQRSIHRAQAEPPRAKPESILSRAEKTRTGWRLELFFTADALHGFDPETNRRLGVMIQVTDPGRGDQFLGVGREFPIIDDPSLWATLELKDPG
jgi:hypothetical protein